MDNTRTNIAQLFTSARQETLLTTATTTFEVVDSNTITMRKTVDRVGEFYFPGDTITFTITITNNGNVALEGLFFRDVIDEFVEPARGDEFLVTTTSGTVTSRVSPITVSNINIPAGGTVTITISGVIED